MRRDTIRSIMIVLTAVLLVVSVLINQHTFRYVIAAVVSALGGFGIFVSAIRTGRSQLGNWVDDRHRSPVRFWVTVGLWMTLSGAMTLMTWNMFERSSVSNSKDQSVGGVY